MSYLFFNLAFSLFLAVLIGFLAGWLVSPNLNDAENSGADGVIFPKFTWFWQNSDNSKPASDSGFQGQHPVNPDDKPSLNFQDIEVKKSHNIKKHRDKRSTKIGSSKTHDDVYRKENSVIREELNQLKVTLSTRENELKDVEKQLQELIDSDNQSKLELKQTTLMYEEMQDEYKSVKQNHEQAIDQHTALENEIETLTRDKQELHSLKQNYKQVMDQQAALENEIKALTIDKQELESQINENIRQQKKIKEKSEGIAVVTALEASVQMLSEHNNELVAELVTIKQQADECRSQYQNTKKELSEQKANCHSITEHFAGMNKELCDSRKECKRLRARLEKGLSADS